MNKLKAGILTSTIFIGTTAVACSHDQPRACADEIAGSSVNSAEQLWDIQEKGSGGGGSSSGGKSGGSSSGGKSGSSGASSSKSGSGGGNNSTGAQSKPASPSAKAPVAPNNKSGSVTGTNKTGAQSKASETSKVNAKPDAADVAKAKAEAPASVSRNGTYTSSVTGNTYIWHGNSYYNRPGYIPDMYDPFYRYNYFYFAASPYYGRPFVYDSGCGQQKQVVEDKNNINITIDNDGAIKSVEDKNPQANDPELTQESENDK